MRFFNTSGPVQPEDHYFIPHRLDCSEILDLIDRKQYFVLHAPRQSGKTTAIQELVRIINAMGTYTALYINIENAQAARANVEKALITITQKLQRAIQEALGDEEVTVSYLDNLVKLGENATLNMFELALAMWAKHSKKPIVLFIDEIDSLIGDSLLSVLRQIRSGYTGRPSSFPQSICLVGLRDVRDYRIWSEESGVYVSASSPFNIKAKSILLPNFSQDDVAALYMQHTKETGQVFDSDAVRHAFYLTQGQPWLVNALASVATTDRSRPVTKEVIEQAKEALIKRRDTHLDSLIDKLREDRVRPIIDAIINSDTDAVELNSESLQYVRDLGLIKLDRLEIANPIYQEVIPRELIAITAMGLAERFVKRPGYVKKDGSLDMTELLNAFTEFYRENSPIWLEKFDYKESGPHLLLMAFLQRIINGSGTINREYALGRGRVDLLIQWQKQRIVLELKVKHRKTTLSEGLEQTAAYMDCSHATEGHLLIFDRDPTKSWEDTCSHNQEIFQNHTIRIWKM